MKEFYLLPTKEGGVQRRHITNMSTNEKKFVEATADCDPRIPEDRELFQKLVKEFLFQ